MVSAGMDFPAPYRDRLIDMHEQIVQDSYSDISRIAPPDRVCSRQTPVSMCSHT
ncbi:MAG: hypothetical protein IBX68_05985 [Dehalococcoidia bacterium]|nr:hypothetical protein [Dehalococcoidia bacterium]